MAERPAYWAVIPASVRYDQDLPPNAKLLYGEVTALSDKRGYCYAQNGYFSELFSLSERSITRLFAVLVDRGYLRVDVIRDESTQEVLERRIYPIYDHGISEPPPDIFVGTPPDIAPQDMDGDYTPPDNFVRTPHDTTFNAAPPERQDLCLQLVLNAVFMEEQLSKLQDEIRANGVVSEYKNGENQYGTRKSPEVDVYNAMIKNYTSVIKQLGDLLPEAPPPADELTQFLKTRGGAK